LKPEIVIIDNPRTSIESAYGYWLAAITLLIASLSFGAVTSVAVLLKPIAKEWSLGSGDVALIHCSTMIGAGVGSLLIGRVHDRFGFFWIALLSSVSTAVGLVIAAFATSTLTLHLSYGVLIGGLGQ